MNKTRKYRIWVAVPVEVEAYDEINAEEEAMSKVDLEYYPPIETKERRRRRKLLYPISRSTEIKIKNKWRPL